MTLSINQMVAKIYMDFHKMEKKWQKVWADSNAFKATETRGRKKCYVLEMFPYPSGTGLHMGHIRNYSMGDAYARFKRMQGFNVLYPMGYDAFGLPAENAAIKAKSHPKTYTEKAIEDIRGNQKEIGLSYDWSREISTCYPEYYRWNQWFFLQFLKNGLAYRKKAPVNWCSQCKTVLANEQVEDGKCWRCGGQVEIKSLEQWFFRITQYADELLKELDSLEWPESIKLMQKNWIGRSEGTEIEFPVEGSDMKVRVFTTRPDTLYGVTFLVYAPEHPDVSELVKGTDKEAPVKDFISRVVLQEKFTRTSDDSEKEGLFTGRHATNPATGERIPIYIANFVLPEYGTGAIIAVPAHDQRDFMFAKKYGLPIKIVIEPYDYKIDPKTMTRAFTEPGRVVNSGQFDGIGSTEAIDDIAEYVEKQGFGRRTVQYKLRDWLVSRQRYWGTPIPVIYCGECGAMPVPEKDLPVLLPEDVEFTGKGNPLKTNTGFVNTRCPNCGKPAKRETDTMDTFVDSSWYFLRFCSPDSKSFFDLSSVKYWMPVDQYIGGAEHAVMHLLYARFFTKVLRDLKLLDFSEPFKRLFNQGIVYKDGHKMSKSFGNVVTQQEIAKKYGIDTARLFLLFLSSPEKELEWDDRGVAGSARFINRAFSLYNEPHTAKGTPAMGRLAESKTQSLIMDMTADMDGLRFNVSIGRLMKFVSFLSKHKDSIPQKQWKASLADLALVMNPFIPHLSEECWEMLGNSSLSSLQKWPEPDRKKIDRKIEIAEELFEQAADDIREVMKITGKKPGKIRLYIAPEWKRTVYREIASGSSPKEVMTRVMKEPSARKEGKEAARFAESLSRAASLDREILSEEEEAKAFRQTSGMLEREFSCPIEILNASGFRGPKALRAEPGKPGIELE